MIDREKLEDTFQYYDKNVIVNIIDIFGEELPGRLEKIRDSIRDNDLKALAFSAHSLKGITGTFMAPEPTALAGRMEEMARQNTPEGLPALYDQLHAALQDLLEELTELRKTLIPDARNHLEM